MSVVQLLTQRDGIAFPEFCDKLSIPKSSCTSLLATMVAGGFLDFDSATRKYHLGLRVWEAGAAYVRDHGVARLAQPHLETIRDELNETAQMAILDGIENLYIAKVEADHPLTLVSNVGTRLPAYATGLGKALLSGLDNEELERRFRNVEFRRFTSSTTSSLDELLRELEVIRRRGYATDNGEYTLGVVCVAAPVRNQAGEVVAAISVSVPEIRAGAAAQRAMVRVVTREVALVSAKFGSGSAEQGQKLAHV